MVVTGAYGNLDWMQFALTEAGLDEPDGIRGGYSLNLDVSNVGTYKIYNSQGRLMDHVNATSSREARDMVRSRVMDAGIYMVKTPNGSSFRMNVK